MAGISKGDIGDGIPGLRYTELPSQGEYHWGVHMDSMAVGGSKVGEIVCSPRCAVIVDSGTSLIALPTMLLEEILETVGEVREDCSNLHSLPNISIQMSGSTFTLPPQIYVARMRDVSDASALRFSPFGFKHIERSQNKRKLSLVDNMMALYLANSCTAVLDLARSRIL